MLINGVEYRYVEKNVSRHGGVRLYFRTVAGRIRLPDPMDDIASFKEAYAKALTSAPPSKVVKIRRKPVPSVPLPTCDPRITVRMFTRIIAGCRTRAARKGLDFDLNESWAHAQYIIQDGLCAVTNVPLVFPQPKQEKLPNQISVDRINSKGGYVEDNCRLVALSANFAMNIWGEELFKTMLATASYPR